MADVEGNGTAEAVHGLVGIIREAVDDDPRFAVLDAIGSAMGMTLLVGDVEGRELVITIVPNMVKVLEGVQKHHAEHHAGRERRVPDEPY
jgi:hypothetical protein